MSKLNRKSHETPTKSWFTISKVSLVLLLLILTYFISPFGISYATSESMEPTINEGEGFLYQETGSVQSVENGEIVIFYSETVNQRVTHTVIGKTDTGELITKGVNNTQTDQEFGIQPVSDETIIGKAVVVDNEPITFPVPEKLFEFIISHIWLTTIFILSLMGVIGLSTSVIASQNSDKQLRDSIILEFSVLLSIFTIFTIGITSRAVSFIAFNSTETIEFTISDSPFLTYFYTSPTKGVEIVSSHRSTVTASIPQELLNQTVTIKYYVYPNILPQPLIEWLFNITPHLATLGTSIPILLVLWGMLYAVFGGKTFFRF